MKKTVLYFIMLLISVSQYAQNKPKLSENRVVSVVDSTHANNMVLTQMFEVNANLDQVWDAYTTKKGWESWVAPVAEVDFKIGGLIQTNYDKNAKIGDKGTVRLHVINYVPNKMITLQAEVTENFPDILQRDAKNLFNVIVFEETQTNTIKVTSYGIGYRKSPEYIKMMKFFISGNEASHQQLISYLESGQQIKF